jgi:hypothetical protein
MKFDEEGELKHTRVWYYLDDIPRWATEIAYFYSENVMAVRIENYENLDEEGNPSVVENFLPLERETTISEHLWYLLRLEPLRLAYLREFDLNAFPNATQTISGWIEVVDEQSVETPADTFDCWLVRGSGPFDWMWVEKGGRVIAKVVERTGGLTLVYMLESYA